MTDRTNYRCIGCGTQVMVCCTLSWPTETDAKEEHPCVCANCWLRRVGRSEWDQLEFIAHEWYRATR